MAATGESKNDGVDRTNIETKENKQQKSTSIGDKDHGENEVRIKGRRVRRQIKTLNELDDSDEEFLGNNRDNTRKQDNTNGEKSGPNASETGKNRDESKSTKLHNKFLNSGRILTHWNDSHKIIVDMKLMEKTNQIINRITNAGTETIKPAEPQKPLERWSSDDNLNSDNNPKPNMIVEQKIADIIKVEVPSVPKSTENDVVSPEQAKPIVIKEIKENEMNPAKKMLDETLASDLPIAFPNINSWFSNITSATKNVASATKLAASATMSHAAKQLVNAQNIILTNASGLALPNLTETSEGQDSFTENKFEPITDEWGDDWGTDSEPVVLRKVVMKENEEEFSDFRTKADDTTARQDEIAQINNDDEPRIVNDGWDDDWDDEDSASIEKSFDETVPTPDLVDHKPELKKWNNLYNLADTVDGWDDDDQKNDELGPITQEETVVQKQIVQTEASALSINTNFDNKPENNPELKGCIITAVDTDDDQNEIVVELIGCDDPEDVDNIFNEDFTEETDWEYHPSVVGRNKLPSIPEQEDEPSVETVLAQPTIIYPQDFTVRPPTGGLDLSIPSSAKIDPYEVEMTDVCNDSTDETMKEADMEHMDDDLELPPVIETTQNEMIDNELQRDLLAGKIEPNLVDMCNEDESMHFVTMELHSIKLESSMETNPQSSFCDIHENIVPELPTGVEHIEDESVAKIESPTTKKPNNFVDDDSEEKPEVVIEEVDDNSESTDQVPEQEPNPVGDDEHSNTLPLIESDSDNDDDKARISSCLTLFASGPKIVDVSDGLNCSIGPTENLNGGVNESPKDDEIALNIQESIPDLVFDGEFKEEETAIDSDWNDGWDDEPIIDSTENQTDIPIIPLVADPEPDLALSDDWNAKWEDDELMKNPILEKLENPDSDDLMITDSIPESPIIDQQMYCPPQNDADIVQVESENVDKSFQVPVLDSNTSNVLQSSEFSIEPCDDWDAKWDDNEEEEVMKDPVFENLEHPATSDLIIEDPISRQQTEHPEPKDVDIIMADESKNEDEKFTESISDVKSFDVFTCQNLKPVVDDWDIKWEEEEEMLKDPILDNSKNPTPDDSDSRILFPEQQSACLQPNIDHISMAESKPEEKSKKDESFQKPILDSKSSNKEEDWDNWGNEDWDNETPKKENVNVVKTDETPMISKSNQIEPKATKTSLVSKENRNVPVSSTSSKIKKDTQNGNSGANCPVRKPKFKLVDSFDDTESKPIAKPKFKLVTDWNLDWTDDDSKKNKNQKPNRKEIDDRKNETKTMSNMQTMLGPSRLAFQQQTEQLRDQAQPFNNSSINREQQHRPPNPSGSWLAEIRSATRTAAVTTMTHASRWDLNPASLLGSVCNAVGVPSAEEMAKMMRKRELEPKK